MKQIKLILAGILMTLALTNCDSNQSDSPPSAKEQATKDNAVLIPVESLSPDELFQQSTKALFKSRAVSATLLGLSDEAAGGHYGDLMEDYSATAESALRQRLQQLSTEMLEYSTDGLSKTEIENLKVMANITRYFAGHPDFDIGYIDSWMGLSPFIVSQINGPLIDIPRYMQNDQKVSNLEEAEDYLSRLGRYDQLVASVQQKLDADVAKGWIAPRVVLEGAVRYLKGFTQAEPSTHGLVTALAEKLDKVDSLTPEQKQELINSATDKVSEIVYPAYQAMAERTESLLDKAREESGIWAQPEGAAYYQDAIRQLGDSELSPEAIHQIGLDEVARISQQMDKILTAEGYAKGSVGERMVQLNEEARFLYPDSAEGRKALLNDLNGYIEEINIAMEPLFKTKPPYRVEVRAFPVEIQDGAPGGQYTPPSVDGEKPGVYWINLRDMKANPKFGLKTLTYHEANPGHHWQIALNLAQQDLPFLRRIAPYNAYVEGWALYSEKVASELGLYKDDPFGDLGRLQAELFRAVRLVVDTGLHHKRWTREEAIDYMSKTTGTAQSDVIAEIERYMTWPGQALGYKLGMLKILELRETANKALGEQFDLAEFHDLVLLGGAVPMTVLESKVKHWIAEKKK